MPIFGNRASRGKEPDEAEQRRRAGEAERSGLVCLKDGNVQRALVEFQRCVDLDPGYALGHSYLGLALYRIGRLADAEAALRRATTLAPEDEVIRRTFGMILEALGDLDGATEHYRVAAQVNPSSARAHAALGSLALKRGDLVTAEDHVLTALRIDPHDAQAIAELAEVHRLLGNRASAIELLRRAVAIRPQSGSFHFKLGLVLNEAQALDEALTELRTAQKSMGDDPDLLQAIGGVLMRAGEDAEVRGMYERASKAHPTQVARYQADLARLLIEFPAPARERPAADQPAPGRSAPAARAAKPPKPTPQQPSRALVGTRTAGESPELQEQIASLEVAVRAEPQNSRLHRDLSLAYMRAGRFAEAKDHARLAEAVRAQRVRGQPT